MSHLEFRMDIIRDLLQDLRDELGLKSTKTKRTEAVKRKADEVLLETISQPLKQCKLEYIPKDFYSATNRKTCQLCDKNDLGIKKGYLRLSIGVVDVKYIYVKEFASQNIHHNIL